jgi:hypothetical protein
MDVSYNEIGARLVPEAGSLLSVLSLEDFIARVAQGDLKCPTNAVVIIHHEDPPLRPLRYLKVRGPHTLRASRQVEPDVVRHGRYVWLVALNHPEPYMLIDRGVAMVLGWAEASPAVTVACL